MTPSAVCEHESDSHHERRRDKNEDFLAMGRGVAVSRNARRLPFHSIPQEEPYNSVVVAATWLVDYPQPIPFFKPNTT